VSLALLQLLEEAEGLTPQALDEFLAVHGSPVVEGTSVTFFWRGEADTVRLRHFVFGLPTAQRFTRLDGTDLWYLVFDVPRGSRFEYKIEVSRGGRRTLVRDPLNPRVAHDPFGSNSVCHAAGYETPEWIFADPEARPGTIEDVEVPSRFHGAPQRVRLYRPARFKSSRRYRVLVVFDGEDYLRYAGMKTVLDNLIHRYEIPPLVVAFTQSPDRMSDYAANPAHAAWVADELLPWLEANLPLRPRPADRGLLGASMGAVAALFSAWRNPGRFGRLLLQSGSFAFSDIEGESEIPKLGPVVAFVNDLRAAPVRLAERVFVSCGVYEGLIYHNRSLVPRLQEAGMEVRFVESRDGHNWENWRDRLRESLTWLFPGPIGFVYE
jgi:enterochelin esterase family protein